MLEIVSAIILLAGVVVFIILSARYGQYTLAMSLK